MIINKLQKRAPRPDFCIDTFKLRHMDIQPFTICISPYIIEDLRERLGRARWPDEISGSGWKYGTNMDYLRELCTHWGHGFDWKEQEKALNCFHHYQAKVDGFCLHFIHEQGTGIRRIPL